MCAFSAASFQLNTDLDFLDCMDSHKLPLFYEPTIPKQCAEASKLDWNNITSCFSGKEGTELIQQAQREVKKKIGEGSFTLPLVQVDGREVCTSTNCTYDAVAKVLSRATDAPASKPDVS